MDRLRGRWDAGFQSSGNGTMMLVRRIGFCVLLLVAAALLGCGDRAPDGGEKARSVNGRADPISRRFFDRGDVKIVNRS